MTHAQDSHPYWLKYRPWFGSDVVEHVETQVEEAAIESAGLRFHLDIYRPEPHQPSCGTVVLSHGMAGYGRLLAPFAVRLRRQGFHVLCPDLRGYGFNADLRGDWTWDLLIQNLLDALDYARGRFDGPLFLAGASMGGPLAFHTACRRSDLAGLATYCLFDYRDPGFLREVSGAGPFTPLMRAVVRAGAAAAPHLRIPAGWVAAYRHLAEDPAFVHLLREDPCAGNCISLRAVASMLQATPAIEYEQFRVPTIVLQPEDDRMIPAQWSRFYYDRLGCPKQYVPIPNCGHWTLFPDQLNLAVGAMGHWFKSISMGDGGSNHVHSLV